MPDHGKGAENTESRRNDIKIAKKTVTVPHTGLKLNYVEFLPESYAARVEAGEKLPLVIFLHGSGERGDDHDLLTLHGRPHYALAGKEYPFVMIAPQCPNGLFRGCQLESLNLLPDGSIGGLCLDPKRVYLTGLSMGGTGTFLWAMSDAHRFAALSPVCGAGHGCRILCYQDPALIEWMLAQSL